MCEKSNHQRTISLHGQEQTHRRDPGTGIDDAAPENCLLKVLLTRRTILSFGGDAPGGSACVMGTASPPSSSRWDSADGADGMLALYEVKDRPRNVPGGNCG
jgi:hypothetical protein